MLSNEVAGVASKSTPRGAPGVHLRSAAWRSLAGSPETGGEWRHLGEEARSPLGQRRESGRLGWMSCPLARVPCLRCDEVHESRTVADEIEEEFQAQENLIAVPGGQVRIPLAADLDDPLGQSHEGL